MSRPGVYVTESVLPTPVADAAPSSAAGALVAELSSGPVGPVLINSWYSFTRVFGNLDRAFPATFAANMFFRAGGRELYVARVVRDDAVKAAASILGDGDDEDSVADEVFLTFRAKSVGTYGNSLRVRVTKNASDLYDIEVLQEAGLQNDVTDDTLLESFRNVDLTHGNQEVVDTFALRSQFLDVVWGEDDSVAIPTTVPTLVLTGGTDGTEDGDLTYGDALDSLREIGRALVLFSPANTDSTIVSAMVEFAEETKSFAVLDTDSDTAPADAVTYAGNVGVTTYAAVYYPHVWVTDPTSRSRDAIIRVAPSGAVAGAFLATDASQGVFKAPAGINLPLPGVIAVERSLTNEDLDALNNNTSPVNAIRVAPGVGPVIMGARTLNQGAATRYVNVRRSLSFLTLELESRLQFALFRNNNADLWAESSTILDNFLRGFFNAGGLRGNSTDEAYYIKIDAENNTESDLANGIMNVEVGVALQYPAEFIRVKLTQQTLA